MRAPAPPRMDVSVVRSINNAGPVRKRRGGNSVLIPAPSHTANWSHRAWKPCRLMAIINSTKELARGRHQTGSSSGSDRQQVCRALAMPWQSQREFHCCLQRNQHFAPKPCCSHLLLRPWHERTTQIPDLFHRMPTRTE